MGVAAVVEQHVGAVGYKGAYKFGTLHQAETRLEGGSHFVGVWEAVGQPPAGAQGGAGAAIQIPNYPVRT